MSDAPDPAQNQPAGYVPPAVWTWDAGNGGAFANINRPVSGATHDQALPMGDHRFQLWSLATPNGQKVTIMLEELLEAGHAADYDAWPIDIRSGDQFGSGFVGINPNSKIPAMLDRGGDVPVRLFESGSILFHLAESFGAFLPAAGPARAEVMNWLMWQMGSAPMIGGGFGHFYAYAPFKIQYAIDRYAMETKRLLHVLDTSLADRRFVAGDDYSIADIALWPWINAIVSGSAYDAGAFLSVQDYAHVRRWAEAVGARPAVQRGRIVNAMTGPPESQLHERHAPSDFALNTQDKVLARGGRA